MSRKSVIELIIDVQFAFRLLTCDFRANLMESRFSERQNFSGDSYFGYEARLLHRISLVLF